MAQLSFDNEFDPEGEGGDNRGVFYWIQRFPDFVDKPATIEEFLGPDYLGVEKTIRPGVRSALIDIFGSEVHHDQISEKRRGMFTGGIGVGKTTLASIAIPYMVHWVLCLRNPQEYFGFMDGTRIAFMLMSTTDAQAKDVLFGDIKARVRRSPWFSRMKPADWATPWDPAYKNVLKFDKDLSVLPGNSQETTFEGYNILGGIIDEGDSHKITPVKDFAKAGWNVIHNRIASRYSDPLTRKHRGLLLAIGQMKSASGFMAGKMKELQDDEDAAVVRLSQWESYGWDYYRDKDGNLDVFWFDIVRKAIVSVEYAREVNSPNIIPIPESFRYDFEQNPVRALLDTAGIPPEATDPFIVLLDRVDACMDKYERDYPDLLEPVTDSCTKPLLHDSLFATDSLARALHIDMAYSDAVSSDALGIAMGHVAYLIDFDGEIKEMIVFDLLMRIKAQTGQQILLSDIRQLIYTLKKPRSEGGRGFKIRQVTLDGVQSVDTIQTLRRKRVQADYLSVDKSKMPYEDLRDAIYEGRVMFPRYMTYLHPHGTERVNIAKMELSQLSDHGKKVDHSPNGSKDVADAMAAVVHVLQGSGQFRRGHRAPDRDLEAQAIDEYGNPFNGETERILTPADLGFDTGIPPDLMAEITGERPVYDDSDTGIKLPRLPRGLPGGLSL